MEADSHLSGVLVDDKARRITFQLSEPDPGFLYKLTFFVIATPPDARTGESAKPLAGTGPYYIASFRKGVSLELRRNPYFRQWSYAAQPAGYPDVIRYVKPKSSKASGIDDILAGRTDVMRSFADAGTNNRLRTRYPMQFHEQPGSTRMYLMLNLHLPPFDRLAARRAINYAPDRRQFAQILGGDTSARPTCQILPPGFPGYVRNCPYATADLSPNLVLARCFGCPGRRSEDETTR